MKKMIMRNLITHNQVTIAALERIQTHVTTRPNGNLDVVNLNYPELFGFDDFDVIETGLWGEIKNSKSYCHHPAAGEFTRIAEGDREGRCQIFCNEPAAANY